eukprot:m.86197 g.86197  ORF g.86197 m.86197 type:complete len:361 (-) comp9659_c1_seq1:1604-2686(-)
MMQTWRSCSVAVVCMHAMLLIDSVGSMDASQGACAEGLVSVRARDPRYAGTYEVAGQWAGQYWYQKQGGNSASVLYAVGGDRWIVGTTLGVRDLQNRRFASRSGRDLFAGNAVWQNEITQRADPAIHVDCGPAKPRVLSQDTAESIALFKTGGNRHMVNFLGVYRATGNQANGQPIYSMTQNNDEFFLSFNPQNQWIIGRVGDVGTTSGFAFIHVGEGVGIQSIDVPTTGVWQIADRNQKWVEHPDLLVARGTGGKVRIAGRVGTNEHINGDYQTFEQLCNHRFVYEKNNGQHVLYFLESTQQWHVSSKADVCTDRCWAYLTAGTDMPIDDPEHAYGQWHVHLGGDEGFVVDPLVRLTRA